MNRPATLHDYGARVQRSIAHMAAHLDRELDLETLAGVACFSPFHFHRIFRELTGHTVADTLRRLRLNRAAAELVQGSKPIAAIARLSGYGSVEAFTRAFRAMYGITPGAYRRQGRLVPSTEPLSSLSGEIAMYDVAFLEFPTTRLAGVDHVGPFAEMGSSFERLFAWARPRGLDTPEARTFGIYYDDPESVPAAQLRSVACLAVGPGVEAKEPVRLLEIEAGPCARIVHQGPYAELEAAYTWLYRDWLPTSGLEPADRPCFEEYLNDCTVLPPAEWLTAIHLPLVALPAARAA